MFTYTHVTATHWPPLYVQDCTFVTLTDFPKQFFICNFTLRSLQICFSLDVLRYPFRLSIGYCCIQSSINSLPSTTGLFSSPPCHKFPRNPLYTHASLSRLYVPDENSSPSVLPALHFNDRELRDCSTETTSRLLDL